MMCDEKSTTPKGVVSSLALLPRVGYVTLATLRYRKYNRDAVVAHRMVSVSYRMCNTVGDGHTLRLA